MRIWKNQRPLLERIKEFNRKNALFTEVREYLANPMGQNKLNVYFRRGEVRNGLLYKRNKYWVDKDLHLNVI